MSQDPAYMLGCADDTASLVPCRLYSSARDAGCTSGPGHLHCVLLLFWFVCVFYFVQVSVCYWS